MLDKDIKKRIKESSHDLIMQYSIRSVSMDDIATALGISKKTIYQYYKDKDALVKAVIADLIKKNQELCELDIKKSKNAVHEIFLAMDMMAEMFRSMNPSILFDMQKYHPSAYQVFYIHKNDFIFNMLKQNILRGIKEELYRPEINAEIMSRFRVESMFIPFNPEFQKSIKSNLLEMEQEIITHYLLGLVSLKGFKLASAYLKKRKLSANPNSK